jgi:hypothetical protein
MASDESKLWLAAGIALANNTNAQVLRPHCARTTLSTEDIYYKNTLSERRLYCKECGAQNYVLFAAGCSPPN